jgi:PAS domain S-box-containing protein
MKTPYLRIIGSPFFDFIYPSDQSNFLLELARSDGVTRGEISLLRGDSTPLPVHFSINPIWVEGVQSFSLVITDLTGMKKRGSELRTNNNRYQHGIIERQRGEEKLIDILENISIAFFAIDRQMRFTYVNRVAEESLGISRNALIGREIEVFTDFGDQYLEMCHQVMEEKEPRFLEMFSLPIKKWMDLSIFPAHEGISVYFHDVTERKHIEEALRHSEEMFSQAFHLSPAMMAIYRLDNFQYIDVNDSWLTARGYTRDEIIGTQASEIGEDPVFLAEVMQKLHEQGRVLNLEVNYTTKAEEVRPAIISIETISIDSIPCVLTASSDISGQKS